MAIPQEPNQRWSLDFVSDSLTEGRRIRILCVIAEARGYPCMVVSDNGTELTSPAIRMAAHRTRRTNAEWYGRFIQREALRRVPERTPV